MPTLPETADPQADAIGRRVRELESKQDVDNNELFEINAKIEKGHAEACKLVTQASLRHLSTACLLRHSRRCQIRLFSTGLEQLSGRSTASQRVVR